MDTFVVSLPTRDRLLLAYACSEWAGALTRLTALRQVGCRVPDETIEHITRELGRFTAMWNDVTGQDRPPIEAADQARTWLTGHVADLDAVLREAGIQGG